MSRRIALLVLLACISAACASQAQPASPTSGSPAAGMPLPSATNTIQAPPALQISTETPTEVPSSTPLPPQVTPTVDSLIATSVAQLGPMGALTDISRYYHPKGTPVKIWRGVPVIPEATAGQEFPPFVYSYTAKASLDQANRYYALLAPTLGFNLQPGSGSAGTADQAVHNVTYYSYQLVIVLTSFDSDPGQVIVVISKSP